MKNIDKLIEERRSDLVVFLVEPENLIKIKERKLDEEEMDILKDLQLTTDR